MPLNFGGQANVNSRSRHDLRPKLGDDFVFATYNSNSESCPMYLLISLNRPITSTLLPVYADK